MISLSKIRWPLALLLCALGAPLVSAQGQNVIHGKVSGSEGRPLPQIRVILQNRMGLQIDQTITDADGRFTFLGLGQSIYIVNVEPPEPYLPESESVTMFTALNEVQRLDFRLRRKVKTAATGPTEPLFQQEVPEEAERAYAQAVSDARAGKKEEALAGLRRAVEIFPDYFLALNRLGLEHMQRGDVEEAESWFRRAAEVNRNSASARFGLGWAYYQAERLEEAAQELEYSVQLNRRILETHYFLGLTRLELEQWAGAEAAFKACLELSQDGEHPVVYLYLASIYDHQERYAEAVGALRSYLRTVAPEKRTAKLKELLKQLERKQRQASP